MPPSALPKFPTAGIVLVLEHLHLGSMLGLPAPVRMEHASHLAWMPQPTRVVIPARILTIRTMDMSPKTATRSSLNQNARALVETARNASKMTALGLLGSATMIA